MKSTVNGYTDSEQKFVPYDKIPGIFKYPAELIDNITKSIQDVPRILPYKGEYYDPLYLAHVVISFLFVLLIGYLLALNVADPGRNKKYFWQRTTDRSRSLPKTNAQTPKTRSRSAQ